MLASARIAGADFASFNAFSRVWLLWQILAHLSLKRACADAETEGSWAPVERFGDGALWFRTPEGLVPLLAWFFAQYEDVRRGVRTPAGAAQAIFRRLARSRFVPPLYRFAAPSARYYKFTSTRRIAMLLWVMTVAPKDFQRLLRRENVTGGGAHRRWLRRPNGSPRRPSAAEQEIRKGPAVTRGAFLSALPQRNRRIRRPGRRSASRCR
ncbi:hypothetical protein ACFQY4_44625 [Catellatospora bangladeshensis]|uniref:hypothetical protein n=1 Tax=Catellatospora bangladeshensis TaxID=310355 RepID=UPI003615BBC6